MTKEFEFDVGNNKLDFPDKWVKKGQLIMIHLKSGMLAINTTSNITDYERILIGDNYEMSRLNIQSWRFCLKAGILRYLYHRQYEFQYSFGYETVPQDIYTFYIESINTLSNQLPEIEERTRFFTKEYRFVGKLFQKFIFIHK